MGTAGSAWRRTLSTPAARARGPAARPAATSWESAGRPAARFFLGGVPCTAVLAAFFAPSDTVRTDADPPRQSVETDFLEGAAEEAVVEDARTWEADLLVLGSSGSADEEGNRRGRSVALAIARSAPASVLLVRRR